MGKKKKGSYIKRESERARESANQFSAEEETKAQEGHKPYQNQRASQSWHRSAGGLLIARPKLLSLTKDTKVFSFAHMCLGGM